MFFWKKKKSAPELRDQALDAWQAGEPERALTLARQAVARDPSHAPAVLLLVSVLDGLGEPDGAVEVLLGAIATCDGHDVRGALGELYAMRGDFAAALPHMQRAAEFEPENAVTLRNLGRVFMELRRFDAAISPLARAAELDPTSAEGWACLGNAQRDAGRPDAAIRALDEASRLAPENPQVLVNLGWAYYTLATVDGPEAGGVLSMNHEHLQTARSIFERSLAVDPLWAPAHFGVGRMARFLGDEASYAESAQALSQLDPGLAESLAAGAVG